MRKSWAMSAVASVLLLLILTLLLFPRTSADSVTIEEAQASIEQLYGGEINNTMEAEDFYQIEFNRANGRYLAVVSRADGQVTSLELIEPQGPAKKMTESEAAEFAQAAEVGEVDEVHYVQKSNAYKIEMLSDTEKKTLVVSAEDGEIMDVQKEPREIAADPEDPATAPEEPVAEPERIISKDTAIAIAKETLNGEVDDIEFVQTADGGYYLVEIDDDATDREAKIQIHAIRGETMTVEWDD
ncbi:PepSY domain-containing protein [Planococcus sp. ISL-109]|uniref:PepSY domain-containing protein n=1 Tax=Planococcus sp. ISL-109 TaxID=2819166 RepID=UPI001BEB6E40|nr:PepSY domain-containing protein [Planococcus sp. ISL-109]MBT2581767.1 PepSY domain-containing protein [Planococcus sp. ISL-109]